MLMYLDWKEGEEEERRRKEGGAKQMQQKRVCNLNNARSHELAHTTFDALQAAALLRVPESDQCTAQPLATYLH